VGLKWVWIWEWICPYIGQARIGSTFNTVAACTAKDQKEKEEQKLLSEAWAIMVKDYSKVLPMSEALDISMKALPAHNLPKRSLADWVTDKSAKALLASCLTEPSAVASSLL
jgi:hypothetical protein